MFQNNSLVGQNIGFPDVCLTPGILAGAPGPLPYPNISSHAMAVPSQVKLLILCMPAHNIGTVTPLTNGDQPGCCPGGVASGIMMGPATHTKCSVKIFEGGLPATRMLDTDTQNVVNCPLGMTLVPSQFKILSLL